MKFRKLYLCAGLILIAGIIIFFIGFSKLGFDFRKLSNEITFEEKSYHSKTEINNIEIKDANAILYIKPSKDGELHVIYSESKHKKYDIEDNLKGELNIIKKDLRKWYDHICYMQFETPYITLEIPKEYDGNIVITSKDEKVTIMDCFINNIDINNTDGDICVQNVIVTGNLDLKTTYGKIQMEKVQAENINLNNSDGKIQLTEILSNKEIVMKTSYGNIELNNLSFGIKLMALVKEGDIKGTIDGKTEDYTFQCKVKDGKSNLPENFGYGRKIIKLDTKYGDIDINLSDE